MINKPINNLTHLWYVVTLILVLFVHTIAQAQMEVNDVASPPYDPESLILNELLGEGVQIINVDYQGTNSSVGFFSNAQASIGLESGVLLTTGAVRSVGANIGVDQVGSVEASVDNGSIVQDADMTALSDLSLFNISKYTITFIPSSDSISFRYVFASEEYPEFVCSDYNDIFGFFISGPGINGPFENNAENIALIPGTNSPVTINNVNGGVVGAQGVIENCQNGNGFLNFNQFYNDNDGSNNQPVFDGFLQVFTASASVIPCSTYTIKLVIADQGDPQRDSGVFLEAKSFSSESVSVSVLTQSIDGTIIEGCTDASIVINVPEPVSSDVNLDVNVFGEAQEGSDFSNFPPIIIPAGETSATLTIDAIEDGIAEGLEEIFFDVQLNQCFRDTFSLLINDNLIPAPQLGGGIADCPGITQQLDGSVSNAVIEPITFNSSGTNLSIVSPPPGTFPTDLRAPLDVFGIQPFELGPNLIQSVCLDIEHNRVEDLEIYLEAPGGQLIPLSTGNGGTGANYTSTCFQPDATTSIRDGVAPFSGQFLPEGNFANLWSGDSPLNGTWNLIVIDGVFGFNGILNSWSITFNPIISYEYAWENADGLSCDDCPNPIVTPTESIDYILNVTDNYGCVATDTFNVTIFEDITEQPTVTCTEQSFDALTFAWDTLAGGIDYEININNTGWNAVPIDQSSFRVENLMLDETVDFALRVIGNCNTVEASTNCTTLNCTDITLDMEEVIDVSCNGGQDGRISLSVSGENPPFTYTLSSGNISNDTGVFDGLTAGSYTVLVSDTINCTTTFDFEINEPVALTLTPQTIANIGCNGEEGSGTVNLSGGTPPYRFSWSNGQTDSIFTSPIGGSFNVTVLDANDCEITGTVVILDRAPIELTFDSTATCVGENMGQATVTITGGAMPFTYTWDAATGNQSTASATNLAEGTYSLTVTDANNCTAEGSVTIDPIDTLSTPQVSCGNVTTNTITFIWTDDSNASGFEVNIDGTGWISPSGTLEHTVTGLSLGQTVNIEVRGIGTCNPPIGGTSCITTDCTPIDLTNTPTNVTCNSFSDGSVTVVATGDNAPFTFRLNGESNDTGIFSNLSADNYLVEVEDALGCTNSQSFTIEEPPALSVVAALTADETCDQAATAEVTIDGGLMPFNIDWSTGETGAIASNLVGGENTVNITDANNCTASTSVTVIPYVAMTATISTIDNSCSDTPTGSATVSVSGGSPAYTYLWDDGTSQITATASSLIAGDYNVTITDAFNCTITALATVGSPSDISIDSIVVSPISCNSGTDGSATAFVTGGNGQLTFTWSDNQTSSVASSLSAGMYNLTVSDGAGCQVTETVNLIEPSPLEGMATANNLLCSGDSNGSIMLNTSGGTPGYTFDWSTGATTDQLSNLEAGTYQVTITDANNCEIFLTQEISAPNSLSLNLITTPIQCSGFQDGAIVPEIEGGTMPYDFLWSDGNTSPSLNNLTEGTYGLTITDANGCMVEMSAALSNPNAPTLSTALTQPVCADDLGGIGVQIEGGVGPFQINLNGQSFGTETQLDNLNIGTYDVIVTDGNNCTYMLDSLVIEEVLPLEVSIEEELVIDLGDSLELVPVIINGAPPFNFFWDSFDPNSLSCTNCENPVVRPLTSTIYLLDLVDANGCAALANASISVRVVNDKSIYVPTAFSPNGDGVNDNFTLYGKEVGRVTRFLVFDRWGNLVFERENFDLNDESAGWDGRYKGELLNPNVFGWFAQIEFINGDVEVMEGDVTLMR